MQFFFLSIGLFKELYLGRAFSLKCCFILHIVNSEDSEKQGAFKTPVLLHCGDGNVYCFAKVVIKCLMVLNA